MNLRTVASVLAVLAFVPLAGASSPQPSPDLLAPSLLGAVAGAADDLSPGLLDPLASALPASLPSGQGYDASVFGGDEIGQLAMADLAAALPQGRLAAIPAGAFATAGLRYEPWMAELEGALAAVPGFLAPPALDGPLEVTLAFAGSAPAADALPGLSVLPAGWTAKVAEGAEPAPLKQDLSKRSIKLVKSGTVPNAGLWNSRIGPGTQLLIDVDRDGFGDFLCTANYVWKDRVGNLYLGAAGHCFLDPTEDAAIHTDRDVYACLNDCLLGGQAGGMMQDLVIEDFVKLGSIAYARQSQGGVDVGYDFGLVRIPSDLRSKATSMMPIWDGPAATDKDFAVGKYALLHGNAAYDGEVFLTKSRIGLSLGASARDFSMLIKSSGGDSGSAVGSLDPLKAKVPGVDLPLAGGILTHGLQVPAAGYGLGVSYGTTIPQAQQMVKGTLGCIVPVYATQSPTTSPKAPSSC